MYDGVAVLSSYFLGVRSVFVSASPLVLNLLMQLFTSKSGSKELYTYVNAYRLYFFYALGYYPLGLFLAYTGSFVAGVSQIGTSPLLINLLVGFGVGLLVTSIVDSTILLLYLVPYFGTQIRPK